MKAYVEEMSMPVSKNMARKLYKVEYTTKEGNGYDSCDLFVTFGVFEKEDIAEYVRCCIEKGIIRPVKL